MSIALIAMEINGNVNSHGGGNTEITFSSNYHQATYQCILMPDSVETPMIKSCEPGKDCFNENGN